jgi:hypothetical protein
MGSDIKSQRLIALFLLGCLFFGFPVLYLFNLGDTVFGIPLSFLYLFLAWALLILLMALVAERKSR